MNQKRITVNYKIGISTDKGIVKKVNQDSTMVKVATTDAYGRVVMGVLCDGMGGLAQGEVASAMAVEAMGEWFEKCLPMALARKNVTERLDGSDNGDISSEIIHQWDMLVHDINSSILKYGIENNFVAGTTMVAILLFQDKYVAINVGDSRIYRISHRNLTLLTHDQSVVQSMIDRGLMTYKQAAASPDKSVLLQCIGASEAVSPQFLNGSIRQGDSFIMCSDGFWRSLKKNDILSCSKLRNDTEESMKANLDRLVELVKSRGETDNISVIQISGD